MRRRRQITAALACSLALGACAGLDDEDDRVPPQLGVKGDESDALDRLGFPALATRNTIRVGGGDAAADVAGATSAVFPATSDSTRPPAVVLVDQGDWQGAVAASVLAAQPIGAALLLSDGDELPRATEETLERLDPRGSDLSRDASVIRIGDEPPAPGDLKTAVIRGRDPYERAAAIDRYWSTARGEPSGDVVIASGEQAEWAMPAAAWAAFSGDSVLFTQRDRLPAATRRALRAHSRPSIFILGPERVISRRVARALRRLGRVNRIGARAERPVDGAIAFATYSKGDFGWDANQPGHNFTLASVERPADAAAAAPLATNGVFAPLLLTSSANRLPRALESYLLSVQSGYFPEQGPTGVFNRVWILGDDEVLGIAAQGRLDEITTVVPVRVTRP